MDSARQKLLSVVPGSGPQGSTPQGSPFQQPQSKPYPNGGLNRMSPAPSTGREGLSHDQDAGFQVRDQGLGFRV